MGVSRDDVGTARCKRIISMIVLAALEQRGAGMHRITRGNRANQNAEAAPGEQRPPAGTPDPAQAMSSHSPTSAGIELGNLSLRAPGRRPPPPDSGASSSAAARPLRTLRRMDAFAMDPRLDTASASAPAPAEPPAGLELPRLMHDERARFHVEPSDSPQLARRPRAASLRNQGPPLQRATPIGALTFRDHLVLWWQACASNVGSWRGSWMEMNGQINGIETDPYRGLQGTADILAQAADRRERALTLMSLPLPQLPEQLSHLAHLEHIGIYGAGLQALPESIGDLHNLRHLALSRNPLATLPDALPNLRRLRILDINNSPQLRALPDNLVSRDAAGRRQGLTNLRALTVSGTRLRSLPDSVTELSSLERLDISDSPLTALPHHMEQLHQLKTLKLNGTMIQQLPPAIGGLPRLKELDLRNCRALNALPENIGQATRLEKLDLRGCRALRTLPASIAHLPANCQILVPEGLQAQLATLRANTQASAASTSQQAADPQLQEKLHTKAAAMQELILDGKNPFVEGNPSFLPTNEKKVEDLKKLGDIPALAQMMEESKSMDIRLQLQDTGGTNPHDRKVLTGATMKDMNPKSEINVINLSKAAQMWYHRELYVLMHSGDRKSFPEITIHVPDHPAEDSSASPPQARN